MFSAGATAADDDEGAPFWTPLATFADAEVVGPVDELDGAVATDEVLAVCVVVDAEPADNPLVPLGFDATTLALEFEAPPPPLSPPPPAVATGNW